MACNPFGESQSDSSFHPTVQSPNTTTSGPGIVAIQNGGTGQTTLVGARNALLPDQSGNSGKFLQSDGTQVSWANPAMDPSIAGGRLTLLPGNPVSTTNITNASTIYYSPYRSDRIALYDGSTWNLVGFTELSLKFENLTANTNYDIFIYNNSGTPKLEWSAAWASNTARTDSLVRQNGVWVKGINSTRRYLGTIRTTGANTTADNNYTRFVFNATNRVQRMMATYETLDQWYSSGINGTWAPVNGGDSDWKHEFVLGLAEEPVVSNAFASTSFNLYHLSIRLDNASDDRARNFWILFEYGAVANFQDHPSIGYHWLQTMETTANTAAPYTVYGDYGQNCGGGQSCVNSGMRTELWQ